MSAGAPSRLRHVEISRVAPEPPGRGPQRAGWFQTGGVVFAYSDLEAAHIHLHHFRTEDALNVVHAELSLRDARFEHVASDALDGDFITGSIERVLIEDAGGDGLDFSGSRVALREIRAVDVADKAVSVGEASEVSVEGLTVVRGRFGLVAKDGSRVDAQRVTIDDTWVGIAAFTKKNEYGPAVLHVREMRLRGKGFGHLAQAGSRVTLDGRRLPVRQFESADLYAQLRR